MSAAEMRALLVDAEHALDAAWDALQPDYPALWDTLRRVRAFLARLERDERRAAFQPQPCVRDCGRQTGWGTGERCSECIREEAGAALRPLLPLLSEPDTDPDDHACLFCHAPLSVCRCAASSD